MVASTTETLEGLRVKEQELADRDRELGKRLHELGDTMTIGGQGGLQRQRDQLRQEIRANAEARTQVSRAVWETKQEAKRLRLEETLRSAGYKAAALAGLRSLEEFLGPWVEMFSTTNTNKDLPRMPRSVALLMLEAREWVGILERVGVLTGKDVPESLRPLLPEAKK